jgi:hypothetical protein
MIRIPTYFKKFHLWEIKMLLVVTMLFFQGACGAEFHVSTNGDDQRPGTKEQPFRSIKKAQQVVSPGDTVLIHGGTYQLNESDIAYRDHFLASLISITRNGTKGKPIRYQAAPGEHPVFDCSQVRPKGLRVSAIRVNASWIEIVGLEITGVKVNTHHGHTQSICVENLGNHNLYEKLSMHDGEAIGLYITRGSDNTVLNCDAYRNHDQTSGNGRGGNTDGFGCHPRSQKGENNVFKGCRAWFNSDDGFDCINAPDAVAFINCWAFYNGFSPDFKPLADGNGFKAGGYGIEPGTRFPNPVPRHRVINCLSVRNLRNGFYANHHPGGIDWIHNTAYRNPTNFNFLCRNAEGTADIPGRDHKIIGNLSYQSKRGVQNLAETANEMVGNLFDPEKRLKDADFQNLDESCLTAPRKPNSDLPEIGFMRMKTPRPDENPPGVSTCPQPSTPKP